MQNQLESARMSFFVEFSHVIKHKMKCMIRRKKQRKRLFNCEDWKPQQQNNTTKNKKNLSILSNWIGLSEWFECFHAILLFSSSLSDSFSISMMELKWLSRLRSEIVCCVRDTAWALRISLSGSLLESSMRCWWWWGGKLIEFEFEFATITHSPRYSRSSRKVLIPILHYTLFTSRSVNL